MQWDKGEGLGDYKGKVIEGCSGGIAGRIHGSVVEVSMGVGD